MFTSMLSEVIFFQGVLFSNFSRLRFEIFFCYEETPRFHTQWGINKTSNFRASHVPKKAVNLFTCAVSGENPFFYTQWGIKTTVCHNLRNSSTRQTDIYARDMQNQFNFTLIWISFLIKSRLFIFSINFYCNYNLPSKSPTNWLNNTANVLFTYSWRFSWKNPAITFQRPVLTSHNIFPYQ